MVISDLFVGDIVTDNADYAIIRLCIHGNRYYAAVDPETYLNYDEAVHTVSDLEENHITCCTGK